MNDIEEMVEIPAFGNSGTVKVKRTDRDLIHAIDFYVSAINPQLSTGRDVTKQIQKLRTNFGEQGFDFQIDGNARRVRVFFKATVGQSKYSADWTNIGQDDGVVTEIYRNYLAHRYQVAAN